MSYNHLNTFERTHIEVLSKMGYSTRQIAKQLNHHSTIARELKRNSQQMYQAELAGELQSVCHRLRKCLGWKTSFELFHEKLSHLY